MVGSWRGFVVCEMPLKDLRPHGPAPSCPLIFLLLPGAALAPGFPSFLQASAWHIQPDTSNSKNSPSLMEVHCLCSWHIICAIFSLRNHDTGPSCPHLLMNIESLPGLLLGDLHLLQGLLTSCLDNFRDFPQISPLCFFFFFSYFAHQGHHPENQTWS